MFNLEKKPMTIALPIAGQDGQFQWAMQTQSDKKLCCQPQHSAA